jgi:hypothetical protein
MIRLLTSNEQFFRQQRSRSRSRESISIFMPGIIYIEPEINKEIELQSILVNNNIESVKKDEEVICNSDVDSVKMSKSVQTDSNNIYKNEQSNIILLKIEFVIVFIECLFVFGFVFESNIFFTIPMSVLLMLAMYLEYVRRFKDKSESIDKNDIKLENKVKLVGKHRMRIKFLNTNKKNKKEDNNV